MSDPTTGSGPSGEDPGRPDPGWSADQGEHFITGLVTHYRQPLISYVQRLLYGDHDRAEDLVQETLLRAAVLAPRLSRQASSLRPWLFRVARNLVIDSYRRDRARPCEVRDLGLAATVAVSDDADAVVVRRDLLAAMAALSPAHREVLLRLHYLGETGPQIAAQLGVPVATVKSRSRNAAEMLRRILPEESHRRGRHADRTWAA
ncbi:sigma-70 family RNA polymerase sigma factor [Actinoplanes sp. NPDC049118]|uniref:sigma-70 family RNA polymerase sigma factor n=1 Tax=Actinoplanes sp. NPDC049118 TaxID=3155769 RepID=UPI0033F9272F